MSSGPHALLGSKFRSSFFLHPFFSNIDVFCSLCTQEGLVLGGNVVETPQQ